MWVQKETCVAFSDFEKSFVRTDRNMLLQVFEKQGYQKQLKRTLQGLYNETK